MIVKVRTKITNPKVKDTRVIYINSIERNWSTETRFKFKIANKHITKIILPDEDMVFPYLLQNDMALIFESFFLNKNGRGYNILKASYPIASNKINLTKANGEIVSNNKDIYEIINSSKNKNILKLYIKNCLSDIMVGDRISLVHLTPPDSFLNRLEGHEVQNCDSDSFEIVSDNNNANTCIFTGIALNLSLQILIETSP